MTMTLTLNQHATGGRSIIPTLPPAIQGQLGLRDPRFRPLSTIQTVLRDLGEFDIDALHVRDLLEAGVLIGFNIAVHLNSKVEWRILTRSVHLFQSNAQGGKSCDARLRFDWAQIFRLICPHQKPIVTGLEIRRAMVCDKTHVQHLVDAGELAALKKSQSGPGGSWTISRGSYEQFLKTRML